MLGCLECAPPPAPPLQAASMLLHAARLLLLLTHPSKQPPDSGHRAGRGSLEIKQFRYLDRGVNISFKIFVTTRRPTLGPESISGRQSKQKCYRGQGGREGRKSPNIKIYIKFIFDSILGPGQGYHHISHVTRDTCSRF